MDRKSYKLHFQQVNEENLEDLTKALLEAATADRDGWTFCPNCNKKVPVPIADLRARTDAISKLAELGGLKPKAEEPEAGSFIVKRTIVRPDGA